MGVAPCASHEQVALLYLTSALKMPFESERMHSMDSQTLRNSGHLGHTIFADMTTQD
jgi:hypothetical protein